MHTRPVFHTYKQNIKLLRTISSQISTLTFFLFRMLTLRTPNYCHITCWCRSIFIMLLPQLLHGLASVSMPTNTLHVRKQSGRAYATPGKRHTRVEKSWLVEKMNMVEAHTQDTGPVWPLSVTTGARDK